MKFEFWTEDGERRAVCRDVGKITGFKAFADYSEWNVAFWVDNKRYEAYMKPTAARYLGYVDFGCAEDGESFELPEPPESGVLDDWRTPIDAACADPRIVRAYILSVALRFRGGQNTPIEKALREINAILSDIPTRAEALEWLKANRFPTEPLDFDEAEARIRAAEDAEDFSDYIHTPSRLLTDDF